MLPLTFDRHVLTSPLLDYDDATGRVMQVLRAIVDRRILPGFAGEEDVDPVQFARACERYRLTRWEDVRGRRELVSLVSGRDGGWTVLIHERIFDYFAFGLPLNPEQAFDAPTREARKVLALAEFVLRHEFDHIVRPLRDEREVLEADCAYVRRCRESEPELHAALVEALSDTTNGLRSAALLDLFARHDAGNGFESAADAIVSDHIPLLCELSDRLLSGVFATMGSSEREALVDACYRRATDPTLPIGRRAEQLSRLQALFKHQLSEDVDQLRQLFDGCLVRYQSEPFLRELEVDAAEAATPARIFEAFVRRLKEMGEADSATDAEDSRSPLPRTMPSLDSPYLSNEMPSPTGSLRERIEAARLDPQVPRSVMRAIDNNVENMDGHSKAKYTEFIETLLAVPWGTIRPIDVGPREFAAGLDASHFGLAAPKELVADFFTNLIWRYREFDPERSADWHRTGSSFLFVGPPGVGKTSLAISIARNLGVPYHKVSLGGMRDESALRGHGFTYEGSKPGAIVQGLVKMAAMNGMFILDEADKTESFAIATLLEILDPEQNHLFHDKYTQTTVDIDLSNCHFILTANTLDTVPAPVIDRCQVVQLDRYSVEEKMEIARRHTLPRLRRLHDITPEMIDFEPDHEEEHLRFLIRHYTHEAGVRQLELVLRTLLLRAQRRVLLEGGEERVEITHNLIRTCLEDPVPPATINPDDRVGEMLALGVNAERGVGGVIPVQATRIAAAHQDRSSAVSMVHATGNLEKVMDESRRVATTAILHCADRLGIDPKSIDDPVHLHFMGGSSRKDGPSAGVAIALALTSLLGRRPLRRDVAATGEIDTQGRITGVGGLDVKLETAVNAGCRTLIIPVDNLTGPGGVARLPESLKRELQVLTYDAWKGGHEPFDHRLHTLQVVAVDHIEQAIDVATLDEGALEAVVEACRRHAREVVQSPREDRRCPVTVLVKEATELDREQPSPGLCAGCGGCRVLVPEGVGQEVSEILRTDGGRASAREIEVGPTALREAAMTTAQEHPDDIDPLVVVAPFFALKQADLSALDLPHGVVQFANNYALQGFKLKRCKPLLNRTVCRLLRLEREALESFPLMSRLDGVWVADLESIPEPYRLDPGRAEELLNRCLAAWLEVIDGSPDFVH